MTKEVIGSGDIASVLEPKEGFTYFASGVSNSQEVRESEYQREKDLLLQQDPTQRLVYFGSLSIFYNDNRYAQHKREMEELIQESFPKYCIVRIGNIVWGENPNTIVNFFRNKVKQDEPVEVRNVQRYVVDKGEFLHWISLIPDFNCEINIPGKRMWASEILDGVREGTL